MNRLLASCLLGLGLVLSGCVVQSFHPFFTDKAVVSPSALAGQWQQIETGEASKPWRFTPTADRYFDVVAYEKDKPGNLKATFFGIGTNLFCDFFAGDPEDKALNAQWLLHVRPVHTVSLVETGAERLVLIPLDLEWLQKALKDKTVNLPLLRGASSDDFLVTASSEEWAKFLAVQAANTNAFARKNAYVFRKLPPAP